MTETTKLQFTEARNHLGEVFSWAQPNVSSHFLGSNLYRLGVPEKVIQQILGHANVSTTATYLHQDRSR
jgi:site-specific recombinase XerD